MVHRQGRSRVVIVGGGFSAATLTVQLIRATTIPLAISIVEPREHLGRGLAFSASDPDHRLNGTLDSHVLDPEIPQELRQWCESSGVLRADPECFTASGQVFLRRRDFGAFLSSTLAGLASDGRNGSTLHHVRGTAVSASQREGLLQVSISDGRVVEAEMLVIATGNPEPALRPPFLRDHLSHPRIVANPLKPGYLDGIPLSARVLIVGAGLTALDVLSTLLRRNHKAEVLVISRHGLRPRPQSPALLETATPVERKAGTVDVSAPIPAFIESEAPNVRAWCRALRAQIRRAIEADRPWQEPFDAMRDVVWKLWPRLSTKEQQRFLRRLRVFYDIHRFRTPPMNDAMVRKAESEGRIRFMAASLAAVHAPVGAGGVNVELIDAGTHEKSTLPFDYIVNCTGLDLARSWRNNPFLQSLLDEGWLRPHPTDMGFDVCSECEAVGTSGEANPRVRVIGPPSVGSFGDPLGTSFIAAQVRRIVPDILDELSRA